MITKLLNDILTVKPRTANREPSSLNFFYFSKDKSKNLSEFSIANFFSNIVKTLFELPIFNQNFNFAKNIYLNVFNKNLFSRRIFI